MHGLRLYTICTLLSDKSNLKIYFQLLKRAKTILQEESENRQILEI